MSTAWWVLVCAAAGVLGYGVALLHGMARGGPVGELPRGAARLAIPLTGLAGRHLRAGLTPEAAAKAVRHLRVVLGTSGLAITSTDRVLAWDAAGGHRHPGALAGSDDQGPRPDDREYCGARAAAGRDRAADRPRAGRGSGQARGQGLTEESADGPEEGRAEERAERHVADGAEGRAERRAEGRAERRAEGRAERRGQARRQGRAQARGPGRGQERGGRARSRRLEWAHPPEDVVLGHVRSVLNGSRGHVVTRGRAGCGAPGCPMRAAVVVPLTVCGTVVGALAAYDAHADARLLRVADELGRLVSCHLELAELDDCRRRVAEAEFHALTAQISPHFVYNSLTAIASFVRTDPLRARELLLDFADFARYALRRARHFTTLADELGCVDRYLLLERARFGDRLRFSVRVAPEVLPVPVPFLCLQPIVENAIKHGLRGKDGAGEVRVVVRDAGPEAHISIEDDGAGMDPRKAAALLGGDGPRPGAGGAANGVGLANVDRRLRQIYGPDHGLVVETAPGQGTKVRLRVPKRWNKHSSM